MKIGNIVPIFIFELKHLSSLHTLTASYTEITDRGLEYLPLLQTLEIHDTKINGDGNTNHCGGLCRSYMKIDTWCRSSYSN